MTARRLIQKTSGGEVSYEPMTSPVPSAAQIVVATRASLISGGTERATRTLAEASLLSKARARPDLVKKVVARARAEGVSTAVDLVRSRLAESIPLGYSGAGVVTQVGEAVADIRPGDRVATAGAGHGDVQVVSGNLAARLPDGVGFEDASFGAVASIALNGVRLASLGPGDRVLVVGLGLVGQLSVRLALAAGAIVAGIDPVDWKRDIAASSGARVYGGDVAWEAALADTAGRGFDSVLITAATRSSDPIQRACSVARDRGTIVIVGDVGLELDRRPLYERELTVVVARSYGPGRYDSTYEELGVDYPYGSVRWTAGRNLAAVLELIGDGRVAVADLITHRFPFDEAGLAYQQLENAGAGALGVVLTYEDGLSDSAEATPVVVDSVPKLVSPLSVGAVGAGRFAREVLFPSATAAGFGPWRLVASATGTGAARAEEAFGFARVAATPAEVIADSETAVVLITTDHASHATYVVEVLEAGRHVFCEKPLAISETELAEVADAWSRSHGCLMVGHNRRWSPAIAMARDFLAVGDGPLQVLYRVNAGPVPDGHWLGDRRQGGRLIGEVCHFLDTALVLVGSPPRSVTTLTSGRGELVLDDDLTVLVGFADGSQAGIVYGTSSAIGAGKERVEVMGRGRHVVIDDFTRVALHGPDGSRSERIRPPDKGHTRELEVFAEMVRGERDPRAQGLAGIATARLALAAVRSATLGTTVNLD